MDGYTVGSVAASVSRGKASSGMFNKLFDSAPAGYTVKYVPVKQPAVKQVIRPKSPVHKSVRKHIITEEPNNVQETRKKKERTGTNKMKKRKIEDAFYITEVEATNVIKKKRKKLKVELSSGDSEILNTELALSRKQKKKVKPGFMPNEMQTKVPGRKAKQTLKDCKEKKKLKIPISEFTENISPETKKKKKKHKEIKDVSVEEGAMESEKEEEHNEDKSRTDESEKEEVEEEELTNKQCALKRLEKKRLKEIKLQHIDEQQNARTVFVGNVPNDIKKKKLMNFFSKFGEVKSVRLRCAPLADPRVPKKVAIIKQKYHPERSNIHAFVCFEDVESAHKALKANGVLIGQHHIRVDMLNNKPSHDQKKAVFIGNLPFAAEEDDLWNMFEACGAINNIRIVRDKVTGVGKGFGYVNFESADAVELALKLNGEELKNRKLRISRYARKPIGRFFNKRMQHRPGFRKNVRLDLTTKDRTDRKERFKPKEKVGKIVPAAEARAQTKVIKKKMKASYQGQKITEKRKMKKNKKKISRTEVKKKILVNKLGVGPKIKKSSKKVSV